jgi:hypothetical protein
VRARPFPFSIRLQYVGFTNVSHPQCDVWRSCVSPPRSLATRRARARPCASKSEAKSEGKSSSAPPGLNRGALGVASGVAPQQVDEATRSAIVHTTSSQCHHARCSKRASSRSSSPPGQCSFPRSPSRFFPVEGRVALFSVLRHHVGLDTTPDGAYRKRTTLLHYLIQPKTHHYSVTKHSGDGTATIVARVAHVEQH